MVQVQIHFPVPPQGIVLIYADRRWRGRSCQDENMRPAQKFGFPLFDLQFQELVNIYLDDTIPMQGDQMTVVLGGWRFQPLQFRWSHQGYRNLLLQSWRDIYDTCFCKLVVKLKT